MARRVMAVLAGLLLAVAGVVGTAPGAWAESDDGFTAPHAVYAQNSGEQTYDITIGAAAGRQYSIFVSHQVSTPSGVKAHPAAAATSAKPSVKSSSTGHVVVDAVPIVILVLVLGFITWRFSRRR